MGEALHYALGQWNAMHTFLDDGRLSIDNNHTERDIRPSAVGKRNWMFIGHPQAGTRSAPLYSILISALNHGVDPQAYLKDVIERLLIKNACRLAPNYPTSVFGISYTILVIRVLQLSHHFQ